MNLLRMLKLSYRLTALAAIFTLGLIIFGGWSFKVLNDLKVGGPVYNNLVQGRELLSDAYPPSLYIVESYMVALQLAASSGDGERERLTERLQRLRSDHGERQRHWTRLGIGKEYADLLLREAYNPAVAFYEEAFNHLIPALDLGDKAAAAAAMEKMTRSYEAHRRAIEHMMQRASAEAGINEAEARSHVEFVTDMLMAVLAIALACGVVGAVTISRSITRPLAHAVRTAQRVAAGDMPGRIDSPYNDEPGLLLEALNEMKQSQLRILAAQTESENGLRRTRELTEHLIDSANVIVLGLCREGGVVIFNDAAEAIFGYRRADVIGRIWRELPLMRPEHAHLWPGAPTHGALTCVPRTHEHPIVNRRGEERIISWKNTVLGRGSDGVALLCYGVDVTEQRNPAPARARAAFAVEDDEELMTSLHDQIGKPIHAMARMSRQALDSDLDPGQRDCIEELDRTANSLLGLIHTLPGWSDNHHERDPRLAYRPLRHNA